MFAFSWGDGNIFVSTQTLFFIWNHVESNASIGSILCYFTIPLFIVYVIHNSLPCRQSTTVQIVRSMEQSITCIEHKSLHCWLNITIRIIDWIQHL